MLGPVLTVGGLAAATLALHLRDPHVTHSWGFCPLYALTGIYCPGCGGLRGVNDLSDGHVGAAASSNLLLVLAVPVVVFLLVRWTWAAWQGREVAVRAAPLRARRSGVSARSSSCSGSRATCPAAGWLPEGQPFGGCW